MKKKKMSYEEEKGMWYLGTSIVLLILVLIYGYFTNWGR